ncbi:MAG: glycosyltransferase family 39 protein [Phycisphaerae bacterium]
MADSGGLTDNRTGRVLIAWLVGATILGGGLRLYRLGAASFWVDELNTIRVCADLPGMHRSKVTGYLPTAIGLWSHDVRVSEISAEHPELWRSLGINEYRARIGSAVIGILSIPLLALASRRLLGARAAGLFAVLLAIAPWHIYWSQASRYYTLQFLFYNLSLIWYFSATERFSRWRMIAAMVAMVLAFLSQPPALVICGIFAIDWIAGRTGAWRVHLGSFGWTAALISLGVCVAVLFQDVKHTPEDFVQFAGISYQNWSKMILGMVFMVNPVLVTFGVLVVGWLYTKHNKRLTFFLVAAAILPTLVFAIASPFVYVGLRYSFVCLFAWLAIVAIAGERFYEAVRPQLGGLAAITPVAAIAAAAMLVNHGYFTNGYGFHTRWRDAFEYVEAQRKADDLVMCRHPMIGKYYLEDADIGRLPSTKEGVEAINCPTWIVFEAEDSVRGHVPRWFDDVVEWKASFDLGVVQPKSSVCVYYYEPSPSDGA